MSDGSTYAKRRGAARRLTQSTSRLVAFPLYRIGLAKDCGRSHFADGLPFSIRAPAPIAPHNITSDAGKVSGELRAGKI